jgi:hypothetical protein
VLIGYMRVSKADGSQVLDLQRDALIGGAFHPTTSMKIMLPANAMTGLAWTRA